MPLSDSQKEKFGDWLHSKKSDPKCPSCGRNEWSFGDIVAAPPYAEGMAVSGDPPPMAQLICKHCAFIILHAAIPIGLIEGKETN